MSTRSWLLFIVLFDVLIFLDDVVCLIDAKFACFGKVGNGEVGFVEQEMEEASVEIGFGEVVVEFKHLGEVGNGIDEIARLCFGIRFFKQGDDA